MARTPEGTESIWPRGGVEFLQRGVVEYAQDNGLTLPDTNPSTIVADPELGREIAAAYNAAPHYDPTAYAVYRDFLDQTGRQFKFLREGLGVKVTFFYSDDEDPYRDPGSKAPNIHRMMDDLCSRRLSVLSSLASVSQSIDPVSNGMFRAVHDAFGHAVTGGDFEADGEEMAWWLHGHLYTPPVLRAFATETRGQQNARLDRLSRGLEGFPPQKYWLLPAEFADLSTVTFRPV